MKKFQQLSTTEVTDEMRLFLTELAELLEKHAVSIESEEFNLLIYRRPHPVTLLFNAQDSIFSASSIKGLLT